MLTISVYSCKIPALLKSSSIRISHSNINSVLSLCVFFPTLKAECIYYKNTVRPGCRLTILHIQVISDIHLWILKTLKAFLATECSVQRSLGQGELIVVCHCPLIRWRRYPNVWNMGSKPVLYSRIGFGDASIQGNKRFHSTCRRNFSLFSYKFHSIMNKCGSKQSFLVNIMKLFHFYSQFHTKSPYIFENYLS